MRISKRLTALASACALALALGAGTAQAAPQPASPGFAKYEPAPTYTEVHRSSFYVTMRDGVKIAFSMLRPARDGKPVEGKFPVVWQGSLDLFTSDRTGSGPSPSVKLVPYGYIVIDIARRGNGASFGVMRGYHDRNEAYDSYEITEWIAAQPWSNGRVGVFGCSNSGESAMHAYSIQPPHLKAVWAGCFSWNKFDGFKRGGVIANWGTGPTRSFEENMKARPVQGDEDRTQLRQAAEAHRNNTSLAGLLQSLPFRDSWTPLTFSQFAYEGSVSTYLPQLRERPIPLYIQAGWFDDFRREDFVTLANLTNVRMLIGPWDHCRADGFSTLPEILRFYDQHLKGIDTGIANAAPLHYFTMGAPAGQEWRSSARWPLADIPATTAWLSPNGDMGGATPRKGERAFQVAYDPTCPAREGGYLQPCHPTKGATSFSRKLTRDTEVTGHVVADLWIAADAADVTLFAYLEDVAPDGTVTAITDARQMASLRKVHPAPYEFLGLPFHRSYAEDAEPLTPGQPARVQFDFLPTSYVFKAGHRLQVSISGSDPRERFRKESNPAPTVRILTGGTTASRILIPQAER